MHLAACPDWPPRRDGAGCLRPQLVGIARFCIGSTNEWTDGVFLAEEKDLVIIGGGVAGYVAAIKAGQEGMKVTHAPRH